MSKKHKKVCITLNYIQHLLILAFTITECVSISAFASLVGIPIGITSSAIGLKICSITAGIKKYMSQKIALSVKSKLNSIEILISKALINSVINHDEFVVMNNVLNMTKWKKKSKKILMRNKYAWCNKRHINIRKKVYWN